MGKPKILAIIPARSGSKGIPKKNIVNCAGKPLLAWTAEAVNGSLLIDYCILSSDDSDIMSEAEKYGVYAPFVRPSELSQDDTPALPMIKHAVQWVIDNDYCNPDIIVLLQPTSPLRTSDHIDEALQLLINDESADSVVSVTQVPHNYSPASVMIENGEYVKPWQPQDESLNLRQLKQKFIARNGAAIYAFRLNCLLEKESIFGDNIIPYYMKQEESVDVDTLFDLSVCGMLLEGKAK